MRYLSLYKVLLVAAIAFPWVAPAYAKSGDAEDKFRTSFGMSFYGFDWCGDAALGALYRKAVVEKFDHCPFPKDVRDRFHAWATDEAAKSDRAIRDYVTENGKLPERLEGMKVSCQEQQHSPDYAQLRDLLERYGRGAVTFDAVIPGECGE